MWRKRNIRAFNDIYKQEGEVKVEWPKEANGLEKMREMNEQMEMN